MDKREAPKICPIGTTSASVCDRTKCACWVGDKHGDCAFKVTAKALQQIASKVSLG